MKQRFWTAAAAAILLGLALDLLIFQVLLGSVYEREPSLHPPLAGPWPKIVAAAALFGWAFTWLYSKGVSQAAWLGQGLRFGLAVGILSHGALGLLAATMLEHQTETIVVGGIAGGILRDVVLGVTVSYIMRPGQA